MRAPTLIVAAVVCTISQPALAQTVLGGSSADFSAVQGQDGWSYGYVDLGATIPPPAPDTLADFTDIPDYSNNAWRFADSTAWTSLNATGGHPEGVVGSRAASTHYAVRRWTNDEDYAGYAEFAVTVTHSGSAGCGDGVDAYLFLDGALVWSAVIGDQQSVTVTPGDEITATSVVDLAIGPGLASAEGCDSFASTLAITSGTNPALLVPALGPLGLLAMLAGLGGVGAAAARRAT